MALGTGSIAEAAVGSVSGRRRGPGDGLSLNSCALPPSELTRGITRFSESARGKCENPIRVFRIFQSRCENPIRVFRIFQSR